MSLKRYKVMAYIMSTGLWDTLGPLSLEHLLGHADEDLERELKAWQAQYDDQFKRYPHRFDWEGFNRQGAALMRRIQEQLSPDTEIYYEPSDDREFFSPEDCECAKAEPVTPGERSDALRERKQSMLYGQIAWGRYAAKY